MTATLRDPVACFTNFGDKAEGDVINNLKNGQGLDLFQTSGSNGPQGNLPSRRNHHLKNIKVEKLDPIRRRAQISFEFENTLPNQRSKTIKKFTSIFTRIESGKIVGCLEPARLALETGINDKFCWDADPLNFDADLGNDNFDCSDNIANLVSEIKRIYCTNNPLLRFENGKCAPIDSGLSCGANGFLRGYGASGERICFTP